MRPIAIVGVLLIVLGIASLFVGIPTREKHGVNIGGADLGVETKTTKAIPVALSAAFVIGGVVLLVASRRRV